MEKSPGPRDMVRSGLCIGCGSCVAATTAGGMAFDAHGQLKPHGPPGWDRDVAPVFDRTCPFSPAAPSEERLATELFPTAPRHDGALGRFSAAYVGYAAEGDFRSQGSSGGMATWMATELLRNGRVDGVAHVVAVDDPQRDGRFFRYRISRTEAGIRAGAKSRYYPVDLADVLRTIRAEPGRYAVVGIPCFVKAVQLLRREQPVLRDRIAYTLGIFCGHMKSARFVESIAMQMGVSPRDVRRVEFRRKLEGRPANWYHATLTLHDGRTLGKDWWQLVDGDWGAGFFMDAACNFCDDVMAETADVSFGDAWVEPYSADWRGNNVMVVRSPEIAGLVTAAIDSGRLSLAPVDAGFVARTQAAGLRQRREGLAYRLAHWRGPVRPRKRVAPDGNTPVRRRRLVYRMRRMISAWSHPVFRLARATGSPALYTHWARAAAALYHALAYHRGWLGGLARRLGLR